MIGRNKQKHDFQTNVRGIECLSDDCSQFDEPRKSGRSYLPARYWIFVDSTISILCFEICELAKDKMDAPRQYAFAMHRFSVDIQYRFGLDCGPWSTSGFRLYLQQEISRAKPLLGVDDETRRYFIIDSFGEAIEIHLILLAARNFSPPNFSVKSITGNCNREMAAEYLRSYGAGFNHYK